MPIVGVVMFVLMTSLIVRMEGQEKPLVVPVVGAEHAPNLIGFLERIGAKIEQAPADYENQVKSGELELVLRIPDDYAKDYLAGRTARVELFVDNSRNQSHASIRRVQHALELFGDQLGGMRLFARGVSPALARPVAVEEIDLATPEKMAGFALGMIPLFLIITAFVGGMYLAIDATAGERERGSLESLLLNPVTRWSLLLGKWLAVVIAALIALGFSLVGFWIALRHVPLEELGLRASLDVQQLLVAIVILVPMAVLSAALQIFVSLFARTYKEAQTYLSLLLLIPTFPATMLSILPLKPQTWMAAVPLLGQSLMLNDLVRGESIDVLRLVLAAMSAIPPTIVFLAFAVRTLGREATVFGRTQGGS
jgi:sodium transport system permease protein